MACFKVVPTVVEYTALVDAFGRAQQRDKMLTTFEAMKRAGPGTQPNIVVYLCIISAFSKAGEFILADTYLKEMVASGIEPNLAVWTAMLNGASRHPEQNTRHKLAAEYFENAVSQGLQLDQMFYNALLKTCDPKDMPRVLKHMKQHDGLVPDVITYNTMVDVCCKQGVPQDGYSLVTNMRNDGVLPDVITYNTLIHGFGKAGQADRAYDIFLEAKRFGIQPDATSYTTLIDAFQDSSSMVSDLLNAAQKRRLLSDEESSPVRQPPHRQAFNCNNNGKSTPSVEAFGAQQASEMSHPDAKLNCSSDGSTVVNSSGANEEVAHQVPASPQVLDLHGLSKAAARMSVLHRLDAVCASKHQVEDLIIITGKGKATGGAVVRDTVLSLLAEVQITGSVLPENEGRVLVPQSELVKYVGEVKELELRHRFMKFSAVRYIMVPATVFGCVLISRLLFMYPTEL